MHSSCLVFPKSEAQDVEKKVAYKKKLCSYFGKMDSKLKVPYPTLGGGGLVGNFFIKTRQTTSV